MRHKISEQRGKPFPQAEIKHTARGHTRSYNLRELRCKSPDS